MQEGAIALATLPQADGQRKNRPVVLLRQLPGYGDWLVCGVSTQLHQRVPDFDELVRPGDAGFDASGLKAASLIRLGFLAAVPARDVLGILGYLRAERHEHLLRRLARLLPPDES